MSSVRAHAGLENNFISILYKDVPKKTKILERNRNAHFNKKLQKQIMIISHLKNKDNESKNTIVIVKFKQQQNLVQKSE